MASLFPSMRRRKAEQDDDSEPMDTDGTSQISHYFWWESLPYVTSNLLEQMEMIEKMTKDNDRANKFFRVSTSTILDLLFSSFDV